MRPSIFRQKGEPLTGQGAERPAFVGYIYGPMTPVTVPADAPPMFAMLAGGKQLRGILGGDAHPGLFIPKLVEYWRQGRFPFDRLLTGGIDGALSCSTYNAETVAMSSRCSVCVPMPGPK